MKLEYLKFMRKYVITYKGKARAIGNTPAEAIEQALQLVLLKVI